MQPGKVLPTSLQILVLKYPTIPSHKIEKQLIKYNNNIEQVDKKLLQKDKKIKHKVGLSEEQIMALNQEFPKFGIDFLYKKAGKEETIEEFRKRLVGFQRRGKDSKYGKEQGQEKEGKQDKFNKREYKREKYGNRYRKYDENEGNVVVIGDEKVNETREKHHYHKNRYRQINQKPDTTAIQQQVLKLFPDLCKQHIQEQVSKMCWKLTKLSKKQQPSNRPENYEANIQFICQTTGLKTKIVQRQFQNLNYNVDGTIQCLLSQYQQTYIIQSCMQIEPHITHIYIDGNNLLYSIQQIRNITLQKGKSPGSLALTKLVNEFNKIFKKDILIVFDQMKKEIVDLQHVKVTVSRPKYRSSDDYLVDLSKKMGQEQNRNSLFVTTDKGLLESLSQGKCNLMRAVIFMGLIEKTVPNIKEIFQEV